MHRIDQLTRHQVERRSVIKHEVVERIGQNFGHPDQARLHVADEEQLNSPEQQGAKTDHQPNLANMLNEGGMIRMSRENPKERGTYPKQRWRQRPDKHENDFASEVVTDLDIFLVLMGGMVDFVIVSRLKEEVAGLAADHSDQPAKERGSCRVLKDQHVRAEKADRTQEVEGLVDTAVVVKAVIVPPLRA